MTRDFFDPTPEQQNVVLIGSPRLFRRRQRMIAGCEACSQGTELPFDKIHDHLTGSDPSVTDYAPARCLQCGGRINEKTLVDLA